MATLLEPMPRVKTPTLIQMEAVECGAAALGILMGYYRKIVPLEELRVACGVSRNGSKASNILKAARNYGFVAKGFKKELHRLKDLKPPFIVFWNFNHFIVIEGISADKVFINDPGTGPRSISHEEFDHAFTGIVLEIVPGENFEPSGEEPSMLGSLNRRLKGSYLSVLFLFLVGLLLVIPGLVVPIFTKIFIDQYLILRLDSWIRPLIIGMAITAVVRLVLSWMKDYYLGRLEMKIAIVTSSQFFLHLLRLPIEFFTQRSVGDITNRIDLNDSVASVLARDFARTLLNVVSMVFFLILLLYYDITLTVVGVSIALMNIAILRSLGRLRKDRSDLLSSENGKLAGTAFGGLITIETLKASGRETDFFGRLSGAQARVINSLRSVIEDTMYPSVAPSLLNALNTSVILTLGALKIMNGYMTIGTLIAFQSLMASFISPLNDLISTANAIWQMKGSMRKLDDVMENKPAIDLQMQSENELDAERLIGRVELKNITFGYSKMDPPLIENFNLSISPGSRVAIVGGSGSGKSTIAKLLAGIAEPWSGEVLFDGKNKESIPRHILNDSVALVDQDIFMFDGTIMQNITMWDSERSEPDVLQATHDAHIHSDITARDQGYAGKMSERGSNFSGGQKQRIEIARALAVNPRILLLDEATSALDPVTEKAIDEAIRQRGCTTIIIAHRLSTIRDCDQIIVMHEGRIVEQGRHEELVKLEGTYANLISMT